MAPTTSRRVAEFIDEVMGTFAGVQVYCDRQLPDVNLAGDVVTIQFGPLITWQLPTSRAQEFADHIQAQVALVLETQDSLPSGSSLA